MYATGRRFDDSRDTFRNIFTDEPCPVRCWDCRPVTCRVPTGDRNSVIYVKGRHKLTVETRLGSCLVWDVETVDRWPRHWGTACLLMTGTMESVSQVGVMPGESKVPARCSGVALNYAYSDSALHCIRPWIRKLWNALANFTFTHITPLKSMRLSHTADFKLS